MPNIFVDDDVYRVLQHRAIPFVDKEPNDVLRRDYLSSNGSVAIADGGLNALAAQPLRSGGGDLVAGLVRRRRTGRRRPSDGTYTSQQAFWKPILELLAEMGGKGYVSAVLEKLRERVNLSKGDFETLRSGAVLWENRAQWARQNMIKQGLLRSDSARGIWEMTAEGRAYLARGM